MPQKPSREGLQITRIESTPAFIGCCCSSLAEHSLGKGEVESSILSSSTIILKNVTFLQGVSASHPISTPLSVPFFRRGGIGRRGNFLPSNCTRRKVANRGGPAIPRTEVCPPTNIVSRNLTKQDQLKHLNQSAITRTTWARSYGRPTALNTKPHIGVVRARNLSI